MIYLDVTTNEDYRDYDLNVDVIGIAALNVYSYQISYNTLIDTKWSGNEQRRDVWTNPRRKWSLDFEKTPTLSRKIEEFFKQCLGRKRAFMFKWTKTNDRGEDCGGDGKWYAVRMDSDDLKFEISPLGYRKTSFDLIEVRNVQ